MKEGFTKTDIVLGIWMDLIENFEVTWCRIRLKVNGGVDGK